MHATCQCGAVRFTTPTGPEKWYICHCRTCRLQSASAFGITALFPYFEIPGSAGLVDTSTDANADRDKSGQNPTLALYLEPNTASGRAKRCFFCGACGTRLAHHSAGSAWLSIKGGTLAELDAGVLAGATHIWCSRAVVPVPEGATRYEGEPDD